MFSPEFQFMYSLCHITTSAASAPSSLRLYISHTVQTHKTTINLSLVTHEIRLPTGSLHAVKYHSFSTRAITAPTSITIKCQLWGAWETHLSVDFPPSLARYTRKTWTPSPWSFISCMPDSFSKMAHKQGGKKRAASITTCLGVHCSLCKPK